MNSQITSDRTHTILVCHSNRNLVRMAKMQAARHGVTLLVAASSQEVLSKATGELRPDAIVLSNDLKNPTTEELMKQLNTDPRLRGVQVVVLKGILESVGQLLKAFPKVPWNPRS